MRASSAKAALRAELSAARRERSAESIATARAAIRAAVLAQRATRGWACIASYEPLRTEPGSPELLELLWRAGVRVLVPLLRPDRDLDWAEWDGTRAASGPAVGIDAINAAEAVLVPALAVARDGTRLGRGGGSYDRALVRAGPGVPIAALVYDDELRAELPRDRWDVRVTAVVTPSGWQDLSATR